MKKDVKSLRGLATMSHGTLIAQSRGRASDERRRFCGNVAKAEETMATDYAVDATFRRCFDKSTFSENRSALIETKSWPMKQLRHALTTLETFLKKFERESLDNPLLTVVFDEVHGIMDETGRNGLVVALNRILSVLSRDHHPWFLFLSTKSILQQILPPDNAPRHGPSPDAVSYRGDYQLKGYPPVTKFTVDIPTSNEA
ncbi:hypothetical protein SI65_08462 [Aspergillus cristatus]|uniref:Uncharacterized protein n=1 Tax=Aspergillus cristatus TaxID=573508 RepID=A0A1E3B552_ASPCR|nr:hypothetical protein SI65_08462 [Aspergillus cristatus]